MNSTHTVQTKKKGVDSRVIVALVILGGLILLTGIGECYDMMHEIGRLRAR